MCLLFYFIKYLTVCSNSFWLSILMLSNRFYCNPLILMKFFIISTFLLIAYIVLDIIFDKDLWNINIDFTTYLQSNEFPGELYMFKFFSLIIQLPIFLGVLQFMLSRKKIESLLYLFLCIIGFVTNGLLKNTYHQPRPYWVEDEIKGYGM